LRAAEQRDGAQRLDVYNILYAVLIAIDKTGGTLLGTGGGIIGRCKQQKEVMTRGQARPTHLETIGLPPLMLETSNDQRQKPVDLIVVFHATDSVAISGGPNVALRDIVNMRSLLVG
jgi:hypothetical protein